MAPLPAGWGKTVTGQPMPNVAAAVLRSRLALRDSSGAARLAVGLRLDPQTGSRLMPADVEGTRLLSREAVAQTNPVVRN